jgi:hypothetical protein
MLDRIAIKVGCCLVLHNMCVSDRVMDGIPRARYNPMHNYVITESVDDVEQAEEMCRVHESLDSNPVRWLSLGLETQTQLIRKIVTEYNF